MIICACIKIVSTENPKDVMYVCGVRHGDCYSTMEHMNLPKKGDRIQTEGFMTHKNEFLDRVEAYDHARTCGQITPTVRVFKSERNETELYSEDLW